MKRMIAAGCLVAQMMISSATAGEMQSQGNPGRNYQTMEGMPLPGSVQVTGTLKGFIHTPDGKPLMSGDVYFFNEAMGPFPAPEKYWRVADELGPMDATGGFSVDLPPGRYYIGAIQRKVDATLIGPPAEGDVFYAGTAKYEVLPGSVNNVNILKGAKPFSLNSVAKGAGVTAIEGSVVDNAGKPVENAIIFAHKLATMNDRPLFVSVRTDKGGAFRIRVADSGTYYLRVRDLYGGGMPAEGSFMGAYGGKTPKGIIIKQGEVIKGIQLTGEKFLRTTPKTKDLKK